MDAQAELHGRLGQRRAERGRRPRRHLEGRRRDAGPHSQLVPGHRRDGLPHVRGHLGQRAGADRHPLADRGRRRDLRDVVADHVGGLGVLAPGQRGRSSAGERGAGAGAAVQHSGRGGRDPLLGECLPGIAAAHDQQPPRLQHRDDGDRCVRVDARGQRHDLPPGAPGVVVGDRLHGGRARHRHHRHGRGCRLGRHRRAVGRHPGHRLPGLHLPVAADRKLRHVDRAALLRRRRGADRRLAQFTGGDGDRLVPAAGLRHRPGGRGDVRGRRRYRGRERRAGAPLGADGGHRRADGSRGHRRALPQRVVRAGRGRLDRHVRGGHRRAQHPLGSVRGRRLLRADRDQRDRDRLHPALPALPAHPGRRPELAV